MLSDVYLYSDPKRGTLVPKRFKDIFLFQAARQIVIPFKSSDGNAQWPPPKSRETRDRAPEASSRGCLGI